MQKSAIVALFLSSSSAVSIGFSEMPEGDFNMDSSFVQMTARASAREGSGVRARWVELIDCSKWCNFVDDVTLKAMDPPVDGQPAGPYIPLRDDLANAAIATCKGPEPGYGAAACPPPTPAPPAGGWVATPAKVIYDPVWKTGVTIPDSEHQVQGAGAASNEQSHQIEGPKGLFQNEWNWDNQSKNAQWDPTLGGGTEFTGDMTSETFKGWKPPTENVAANLNMIAGDPAGPADTASIQLDSQISMGKNWVELPDCADEANEIKLAANLENASVATCKVRPAAL